MSGFDYRPFAVVTLLALAACSEAPPPAEDTASPPKPVAVAERWLTHHDDTANIDSVAVWSDGSDRHWLIATAKSTHELIIYDAVTGERIDSVGGAGDAPGRLLRPNGISVVDDLAWVVERDNRRIQVLSLPGFTPVAEFGRNVLEKPYGLWVMPTGTGYRVFVTDAYMATADAIPADAQLDRRLQRFDVRRDGGRLVIEYAGALGPTMGDGRLTKVESLFGDIEHDRLLVADEHMSRLDVKVFDLAGHYTGQRLAEGILQYEPEGIALYPCSDGSGMWIITDQEDVDNRFLAFDRETLALLGAFTGETTANTDGVWLHANAVPGFPEGAFYAVHDDGSVGAFDLAEILAAVDRQPCRTD
ncbi:MAG: phytase [Pseudomonadota bacterium]|nr:MAG: phytase [Pseudomonadota bacterium]